MSGTSQAAAHVTGTVALFARTDTGDLNGDGLIDNEDVRLMLLLTAIDQGVAGKDAIYGYGLVNAEAASRTSRAPEVVIVETTAGEGTVTINGRGFGGYAAGSITSVTGKGETTTPVAGTIFPITRRTRSRAGSGAGWRRTKSKRSKSGKKPLHLL